MRVANSALYARRTPVVTLPQAIAWLGIREVRNIAFAVAVQGQVFSSTYFRQEMNELWRESVITALFAQEIARLKRRNVESAYLCGLLHRAGMAVILSRVGSAVLKHRMTADRQRRHPARRASRSARGHASRHRLDSCRPRCPPRSRTGAIRRRRNSRSTEVMEVALARQISDEMRTPGAGGELPDSHAGPGLEVDGRAVHLPGRVVHHHGAARRDLRDGRELYVTFHAGAERRLRRAGHRLRSRGPEGGDPGREGRQEGRRHRTRPARRRLLRAHRHDPEQDPARTCAAPARAARGPHGRADPVAARRRGRNRRRARCVHGGAARAQQHRAAARPRELPRPARTRDAPHRRLADHAARADRHHRHRLAAAFARAPLGGSRTRARQRLDPVAGLSAAQPAGARRRRHRQRIRRDVRGARLQGDAGRSARSAAGVPRSRAHGVLPGRAAQERRRIHSARRGRQHAVGRHLAGAHGVQGRPRASWPTRCWWRSAGSRTSTG